jgi:hypothetical protein
MGGIPRVPCRGETARLRGHRGAKLRDVGPAERDEAGRQEVPRQVGRERERHVAHGPDPECRRLALDHAAQVLEQGRDTAERAIGQVTRCCLPRRVEPGPDHGVQLRIDLLNPGDRRVYQLPGTHLTAADQVSLCGAIQPRPLAHTANATRAPGNAIALADRGRPRPTARRATTRGIRRRRTAVPAWPPRRSCRRSRPAC